jgi:hypothetical protein
MKIIITESQYERLFGELPNFLKRRITKDDLEYLDRELTHHILSAPPLNQFDSFSQMVIGDLLHNFVVDRKDDEIETDTDPDYGIIYNDNSLDKVFKMYWNLIPILKKRYKDILYQAWERKKSMS